MSFVLGLSSDEKKVSSNTLAEVNLLLELENHKLC